MRGWGAPLASVIAVQAGVVSRESLVVGCKKLVWDAREIASHYQRLLKGFWFDAFVILKPKANTISNLSLQFQNSIYSTTNYIQFSNQIQTHDSSIRALALQLTNLTHFFTENEALGVAAELPLALGEQL